MKYRRMIAITCAAAFCAPTIGFAKVEGDIPMIHPTTSVVFSEKDTGAEAFVGAMMQCPAVPATMFDFLEMATQQSRSLGLRQNYVIISSKHGRYTNVMVTEHTTDLHGNKIPNVYEVIIYRYTLKFPYSIFLGVFPTDAPQVDPLGFFKTHGDAVCNNMLIHRRMPQPF